MICIFSLAVIAGLYLVAHWVYKETPWQREIWKDWHDRWGG